VSEWMVTLEKSWLWLGGSLLLATLWTNLAWFFRHPRPGPIGEFIAHLTTLRLAPLTLQGLRLLYYVGFPFAALLWGHDVVIGRLIGLQQLNLPVAGDNLAGVDVAANWLDWAQDLGWAAALGIAACGLLALGWYAYRRALIASGSTDGEGSKIAGANISGWVLLREAAYHEFHWAFYRSVPIFAAGMYWGTWIGLLLVVLEAMLNPAWRKRLADPYKAPAQLLRGALAVVSSALFLLTQNLWVAIVLHWGISWALNVVARMLPLLTGHIADQASIR